jgi:hypothetical protein
MVGSVGVRGLRICKPTSTPRISSKGMPMPKPTPKPTLAAESSPPLLELEFCGDVVAEACVESVDVGEETEAGVDEEDVDGDGDDDEEIGTALRVMLK